MTYKNPGAAAVLSFFVPGLGQIYNGNFGSGLFHLLTHAIGVMVFVYFSFCFGIGIVLINAAIACYSAYHDAEDYNARLKSAQIKSNEADGFGWDTSLSQTKQASPLLWLILFALGPFFIVWLLIKLLSM